MISPVSLIIFSYFVILYPVHHATSICAYVTCPLSTAESRTWNTILGSMPGVQKVEEKTMGDGEAERGGEPY